MGSRRSARRRGRSGGASHAATPARLLARDITRETRERDAYVREIVGRYREKGSAGLDERDFDFAQVLSFGVVMCAGTLDEFIDRNLRTPDDIRPNVRDCLRISAYELLFLKHPAHAVVDQGVELVRATARKAAGLANAVLRKMSRDAEGFPWGDASRDDGALARNYGVPLWLARELIGQYGRQQACSVLACCLEPAPTYWCDNPYLPGDRFVSDESAQRVAGLVPLEGTVLEIGAGRGTKTMLMQARALEELGRASAIHTVDVHPYKVKLLAERLKRAKVPGVTTHTGDGRDLSTIEGLPDSFDAVFLDAPCSGTGTMRRHPEIRWHLSPADVDALAGLQLALLREASSRVRPGATLVYSTCSILAEENEDVVAAFLQTAGEGFERVGGFSSLPVENGPDGHFATVLTRV